ncbi:MAG: glutathione S-transferase family protein [Hyphomicrobiaceae bacterium]
MLTLLGNLHSGNVHKVQMILARRGIPFRRVEVRQDLGQPRDPRFLALNPMGKVPAVLFPDGDVLSDSGALLYYFAEGTPLWPDAKRERAEVLRWMFFEQYSHEPALAVLRYLRRYARAQAVPRERMAELEAKSAFALGVLETRLAAGAWIAGPDATIADYALYPYTCWMEEIGFSRKHWPAINRWLSRVEQLPGFLPLYTDGATEVVDFADYFGGGEG